MINSELQTMLAKLPDDAEIFINDTGSGYRDAAFLQVEKNDVFIFETELRWRDEHPSGFTKYHSKTIICLSSEITDRKPIPDRTTLYPRSDRAADIVMSEEVQAIFRRELGDD